MLGCGEDACESCWLHVAFDLTLLSWLRFSNDDLLFERRNTTDDGRALRIGSYPMLSDNEGWSACSEKGPQDWTVTSRTAMDTFMYGEVKISGIRLLRFD